MKTIIQLFSRPAATITAASLVLLSSNASSVASAKEDTISKSFTVEPGGKLIVDADRGSIHVGTADQNKVEVVVKREVTQASEAEAARILKEHEVTLSQEGNEVRVVAKAIRMTWRSWFGRQPNLSVRYQITVPRKFEARLKSAAGSVEVADLQGSVEARSSAGALVFRKIAGPVDGHTSAGSVKATGCDGKLKLQTSAGSIDVTDYAGTSVQADTSAGSISVDLNHQPEGDCTFRTSAGSIRVKLPATTAANLDAKTSAGKITTDFPVTVQGEHGKSTLRGTINGGGPTLSLKTSAGSIQILKQ